MDFNYDWNIIAQEKKKEGAASQPGEKKEEEKDTKKWGQSAGRSELVVISILGYYISIASLEGDGSRGVRSGEG